jgi:hypothetical protein
MHEFIVLFIARIRCYSYYLLHSGSLYETYQDFYAQLLNIIHNCQISTKSYCLAGTDSKLKGIEQALEEVQVSRLYIIFTYDS